MTTENVKESRTRSLLKALSWRVVATTTTMLIAYLITGEFSAALTIGGIEFFLKFIIYYAHERAWQMAPRGSVRKLIEGESSATTPTQPR